MPLLAKKTYICSIPCRKTRHKYGITHSKLPTPKSERKRQTGAFTTAARQPPNGHQAVKVYF